LGKTVGIAKMDSGTWTTMICYRYI
jgi:hypothetical protein